MCSWRSLLFVLAFAVIQIEAAKYGDTSEYEEWLEFKDFQRWRQSRREDDSKRLRNSNYDLERHSSVEPDTYDRERNYPGPPPIEEAALMARYIVNQNNWTSVATISSISNVQSFPFVNVVSYADGPLSNGTGMPYLYITPLDYTAQDLAKDARATLSMTLAASEYCAQQSYDPMDPRCARVYLTGIIAAVKNHTAEYEVAKDAVFGRHPWLAHMPPNHHFFFVKIKLIQIALLDTFGGPKYITPKEYFAANTKVNFFQKNDVDYSYNYQSGESRDPSISLL